MQRELIQPLLVWDCATGTAATLKEGLLLDRCEILRNSCAQSVPDQDAYVVDFEAAGRRYRCPLFRFLPRARTVDAPSAAT
ncbi:MAG TPA: hypothetical protein VGF59_15970 [Bryobacteraceae bacterium]